MGRTPTELLANSTGAELSEMIAYFMLKHDLLEEEKVAADAERSEQALTDMFGEA